jgi:hypothetical protein
MFCLSIEESAMDYDNAKATDPDDLNYCRHGFWRAHGCDECVTKPEFCRYCGHRVNLHLFGEVCVVIGCHCGDANQ